MYAKLARNKKQKKTAQTKCCKKKKYRGQSQWHPAWASVAFIVTPGSIPVVFNALFIRSAPPPFHTHTSPGSIHTSIASILAPESQIMMFFSKSDRCDSTTRCSDGPRRCNRGSMNFNTFAETISLRLPRSYRVAEKSDPISSREPNYAVFQQNPIVVTAQLDAPMDPDAVIAAA